MTNNEELTRRVVELESQLKVMTEEKEKWRKEAFRQYPTPEAYEAVCKALHAEKERAEALKLELIMAKGLVHDGLIIQCLECRAEGTEYGDGSFHKENCRYVEAERLLAQRKQEFENTEEAEGK